MHHRGVKMAKVVMFNKYISDSERKDIESYLSRKWSIKI